MICNSGTGQENSFTIEELLQRYNTASSPDEKVRAGHMLSDTFLYSDRIKAKKYAFEVFPLAKKSQDNLIKSNGYLLYHRFKKRELSGNNFNEFIYLDSAEYFVDLVDTTKSLEPYQSIKLQIYSARGNNFYNKGKMDVAMTHFLDALKMAEGLNRKKNIAYLKYNISICHFVLENYTESIELSKKIIDYSRTHQFPEITAGSLNLIGASYQVLDSLSAAKKYFRQALDLALEIKDERTTREAYLTLGSLEGELNQLDSATYYLEKSLEITKDKDDPLIEAQIYLNLARVESKRGATEKAREFFKTAQNLNNKIDRKELDFQLAIDIAGLEYENKNFKEAYDLLNQGHTKKDSFTSLENRAQFRELELKYGKANDEKRIAEQQLNLTQKEKRIGFLSGGFIISLLGLMVAYFFYRNIKKSQAIIKRELQLKNIEVQTLENEKSILALACTLEGQEAERARIAQDLHDGLGGLLSSVKAHYGKIQGEIKKIESINFFEKAEGMLDNACDEVRRISHNLMPPILQSHGLIPSINGLANDFASDNLKIEFEHRNINERLDAIQEIFIYRICQEIFANILKHAEATKVEISFYGLESEVQLIVEDNGKGFDPLKIGDGLGLQSIKSRVEYLKGELGIETEIGNGTIISISIPKK